MKKIFQGTLLLSSLLLGSFVQANELEPYLKNIGVLERVLTRSH